MAGESWGDFVGGTVTLPIGAIMVGERRREDYGDVDGLIRSLRKWGQCVPILVDQAHVLCDGGRRLTAMKAAGFQDVLVTIREMTEEDRRALELELDETQKPMTPYERSKALIERAKVTATVLGKRVSDDSTETPKDGRPPVYAVSKVDVAEALGTSDATIRRAEKHVAAVEANPDLAALAQDAAIKEAAKREHEKTVNDPAFQRGLAKIEDDPKVQAKARKAKWATLQERAGDFYSLVPSYFVPLMNDTDVLLFAEHKRRALAFFAAMDAAIEGRGRLRIVGEEDSGIAR